MVRALAYGCLLGWVGSTRAAGGILRNPSMEVAEGWARVGEIGFAYSTTESRGGQRSAKVAIPRGARPRTGGLSQRVYVKPSSPGSILEVSAWVFATDSTFPLPLNPHDFAINVLAEQDGDKWEYRWEGFFAEPNKWSPAIVRFKPNRPILSVRVECVYRDMVGTVYFDNIDARFIETETKTPAPTSTYTAPTALVPPKDNLLVPILPGTVGMMQPPKGSAPTVGQTTPSNMSSALLFGNTTANSTNVTDSTSTTQNATNSTVVAVMSPNATVTNSTTTYPTNTSSTTLPTPPNTTTTPTTTSTTTTTTAFPRPRPPSQPAITLPTLVPGQPCPIYPDGSLFPSGGKSRPSVAATTTTQHIPMSTVAVYTTTTIHVAATKPASTGNKPQRPLFQTLPVVSIASPATTEAAAITDEPRLIVETLPLDLGAQPDETVTQPSLVSQVTTEEMDQSKGPRGSKYIIIGVAVSAVIVLGAAVVAMVIRHRASRRDHHRKLTIDDILEQQEATARNAEERAMQTVVIADAMAKWKSELKVKEMGKRPLPPTPPMSGYYYGTYNGFAVKAPVDYFDSDIDAGQGTSSRVPVRSAYNNS